MQMSFDSEPAEKLQAGGAAGGVAAGGGAAGGGAAPAEMLEHLLLTQRLCCQPALLLPERRRGRGCCSLLRIQMLLMPMLLWSATEVPEGLQGRGSAEMPPWQDGEQEQEPSEEHTAGWSLQKLQKFCTNPHCSVWMRPRSQGSSACLG